MSKTARDVCETILREGIRYNLEHEILPSENVVARRLLDRSEKLTEAYQEVYYKLHHRAHAVKQFMGMLLSFQAFWSPEKIAQARADRDALVEINQKIQGHARALADLLEERTHLHNTSGLSSRTLYHIRDVIDAAYEDNWHYCTFPREPLEHLTGQFDLRYWPELSKIMLAIANDAEHAELEATDPLTEAATLSKRPSTSDQVLAFLAYIEECCGNHDGALPYIFQLSDRSMASLLNFVFDLPVDKLLTAEYVKGRRQRARGLAG
ncbi:MAG: hypothetical protein ACN6RG_01080 [Stenotrophomonas sp.]